MSILQEYAKIKQSISDVVYNRIEKFLEENPNFLLSDVYYKEDVWKQFVKWEKENYPDPQAVCKTDKNHVGLPF